MSGETEAVDRILAGGGDADDVLRALVEELVGGQGHCWAGIFFLENGVLELGPHAGTEDESSRVSVPVDYQGMPVGSLVVDGDADEELLRLVAERISTLVLLGWDTGGETWEP